MGRPCGRREERAATDVEDAAAYLHEKAGDHARAARLYAEAADLATSSPERVHLLRQAARLHHR